MKTSKQSILNFIYFKRRKKDEICSKIRNYCAACLSNVFRQNNKLISQNLASLFPGKAFSNTIEEVLETVKEPLVMTTMDMSAKQKIKNSYLNKIKEEFTESSLVYMLLFEENNKVRLSVCKAISAVLDGCHNEKALLDLDNETNKNQNIYNMFKNLASCVIISVLVEDDETFFNHLLRVNKFTDLFINSLIVDCNHVGTSVL